MKVQLLFFKVFLAVLIAGGFQQARSMEYVKDVITSDAGLIGFTTAMVVAALLNHNHCMRPIFYNATIEMVRNSAIGASVGLVLGGITYRYTEKLPLIVGSAAGLFAVALAGSLIQGGCL